MAVTPQWQRPDYVDVGRFDEHDVRVGPPGLEVGGSLCLPNHRTRMPGVVLLAGSGPSDRDATLAPNKALKDVAWGLTSRGIATLRYDKVTHTHPEKCAAVPSFTVVDEYVAHASSAIDLLRAQSAIDPGQVFLLGHSLGGTVAPRIAAGVEGLAGVIVLAGSTQPLHRATVRQVRYLAALTPGVDVDNDPAVARFTSQADLIDSPDFSASTPAEDLPFSVPAAYWLDLLLYDPAGTAAALGLPMLVLQGGRDYQVTVEDDLSGWRARLADRDDVTIRTYPADDHFFFPGVGQSTPASYLAPNHVDPVVIDDISAWITLVASPRSLDG